MDDLRTESIRTGAASTPFTQGDATAEPGPRLSLGLARTALAIEDAQRLRFKVFAEELGADLPGGNGLDIDTFDDHCDHIVVRDDDTLRVVGTYRVLPPHRARRLGMLYAETEFDLHRLDHLRPWMIEVGRSCVHRDYRSGPAIMMLWAGLARYMKSNDYRYSVGCASAPLGDGGKQAAFVRDQTQRHLTPPEYRAFPRVAFPHAKIERAAHAELPALIKGYLRLGAQVCGEPAWDPAFNSADFLMLLEVGKINRRYAKHFDLLDHLSRPA
jgi:putative hemolysin